MIVGILKEIKSEENRVCMTPAGVEVMIQNGHTVLVEKNAGTGSGFANTSYKNAGAEIVNFLSCGCRIPLFFGGKAMSRSTLTGSRIRERRQVLRMKQSDLASHAGISASYLNLIEHNRRRIGGKLLVATEMVQGELFAETVILLLHYDEDGAIGIVVNRPTEIEPEELQVQIEPGRFRVAGGRAGLSEFMASVSIGEEVHLVGGILMRA